MFSNLLLYILVPILLFWFVYKYLVFPLYLSPLSKMPSIHPTAPISAFWLRYQRRGGRVLFRMLSAAHKKHGPIIRLAPNEISVASLEGLRKIYVGGFDKPQWYSEFRNYDTPNLFSTLAAEPHFVQKRMISQVYSKTYIQNSPHLAKTTQAIIESCMTLLKGRGDVNIAVLEWTQALVADLMIAYQFGSENSTNFVGDVVSRQKFFKSWDARSKSDDPDEMEEARLKIEENVLGLVRQTESSLRSPRDDKEQTEAVVYEQLSRALDKSELSNPAKEAIIASELLDHLSAGIDSTSIIVAYLQWELSKLPEMQRALRQELMTLSTSFDDSTATKSEDQCPSLVLPDPKALDKLPFLDAILKETLRMYTPSPPLFTRVAPRGGTTIDGYEIPEGTLVGTSIPVLHWNEEVYPDAKSFKPERWLSSTGTEKAEMTKWFWAFSSGSRMCIGSHLALYILKAIVAVIYADFETEIVDDGGPGGMEQRDNILAGPAGDMLTLNFRPVNHGVSKTSRASA